MIAAATRCSLVICDSLDARVLSCRPRYISPEAGKALEKLSHAIDYLTDEYIHSGCPASASPDCVESLQVLMSLRRRIYDEAPLKRPVRERVRLLVARALAG